MDSKNGYWQRQFYFLSSLGIFYLILIALFAIPLLGTFVVILIKGAFDLRYVIIAGGCVGLIALSWVAVKLVRGMWQRLRRDGSIAGEEVRRSLLLGKPVEISIFNGMLKFSCGQGHPDSRLALPRENRPLLPSPDARDNAGSILDQLQHLSELKQSGAIDADEFNLLKAMLIESTAPACDVEEKNRY